MSSKVLSSEIEIPMDLIEKYIEKFGTKEKFLMALECEMNELFLEAWNSYIELDKQELDD